MDDYRIFESRIIMKAVALSLTFLALMNGCAEPSEKESPGSVTEVTDDELAAMKFYDCNAMGGREAVVQRDTFSRTSKSVTGSWSDVAIDLRFRAGITYTGSFTNAGNLLRVKCNDLSMLD
jgi:hypothetical protein